MSETESLDLRAHLARIDRDIAESSKLRRESDKLQQETSKLWHEAQKLEAERDKLRRDRGLAPWVLAASLAASIIGGVAATVASQFVQRLTH